MEKISRPDLEQRALAAYFRAGAALSGSVQQPSPPETWEMEDGKLYVVLKNSYVVLAVYRVRNDGMLKGLKRWPSVLEDGTNKGVIKAARAANSCARVLANRMKTDPASVTDSDLSALREQSGETRLSLADQMLKIFDSKEG